MAARGSKERASGQARAGKEKRRKGEGGSEGQEESPEGKRAQKNRRPGTPGTKRLGGLKKKLGGIGDAPRKEPKGDTCTYSVTVVLVHTHG